MAIATLTFSGCSKKTNEIDPTGKVDEEIKDLILTRVDDGFHAIDGKTGTLKWKYTGSDLISSGKQFVTHSSDVENRHTIINWSDSTELYRTAVTYETIYTIDASSGQKIKELKFKTLRPSFILDDGCKTICGPHGQWSSLLTANSTVAIMQLIQLQTSNANVILYGVDLKTGAILWSFANNAVYNVDLSITEDRLYIGSTYKSYELDVRTGKKLHDIGVSHLKNPPLYGKYFYSSPKNRSMYVIDAQNGSVIWERPETYSFLASDRGVLFSKGGDVVLADLSNGSLKTTSHIIDSEWENPFLLNLVSVDKNILHLFAYTESGAAFLKLNLDTGQELWRRTLPNMSATSICLSKTGAVYYMADNYSKIVAIEPQTGEKLWEYKVPSSDPNSKIILPNLFNNNQLDF